MTKEVATQDNKPATVLDLLKGPKAKERLQSALANKADIEEFLSNVLIDISKSPDLMACTFESIMQCAIDSANFGLIPNKQLGHAYLIAYNNYDKATRQSRKECTLQIGYKGYLKKISEYKANVEVELVTQQEIDMGCFSEVRGTETKIIHHPIRIGMRTRENIALGYAIIRAPGLQDVIIVMSKEEIEEVAKTEVWDKALGKKTFAQKGVWTSTARATDFGEMCKKTLIRRAAKLSNIDIINKMSTYEGEKETEILKNVTPEMSDGASKLIEAVERRREAEMIEAQRAEEGLIIDAGGLSESIAPPGLSPLPAEKLSVERKAPPKAPKQPEPETKPAAGPLSETVFPPPVVLKHPDGTEFTFGIGGEVSEHDLVKMMQGYSNDQKTAFVTKNDENLIPILARLRGAGLPNAAEAIKAMRDRIQEDGGLI